MESQLQNLIEKIRSDGIAEGQKQSQEIQGKAQEQAKQILRQAKEEAFRIINEASDEAKRTEEAGKKALEQAGRNLILSLRKSVAALFDRVLQESVADRLTPETMASMLEKIAGQLELKGETGKELELLLGKEAARDLEDGLLKKLQKRLRTGITIRPLDNVSAGFWVGEKGGNAFYDFTDKGIAEVLSKYLNPRLAGLLREKAEN